MKPQDRKAMKATAEMWNALVEDGIPAEHATRIIVGIITKRDPGPTPDLRALFPGVKKS